MLVSRERYIEEINIANGKGRCFRLAENPFIQMVHGRCPVCRRREFHSSDHVKDCLLDDIRLPNLRSGRLRSRPDG
jgi:hypothetical protein